MYDNEEVIVFEPTAEYVNVADALRLVPVVGLAVPSESHLIPVTEEIAGAAYAVTVMVTDLEAVLPLESVIVAVYVWDPDTVNTAEVALALACVLFSE